MTVLAKKLNVRRTDSWLQKKALELQNRADMGIFSMKNKGTAWAPYHHVQDTIML